MEEKDKESGQTVMVDLKQLLEVYDEVSGKNAGTDIQSLSVKQNPEVEFNIINALFALLKRLWIIVLAALVCGIGAFGYFYTHNEVNYNAVAKMYVNNDSVSIGPTKVSISLSDLNAAESLIETYFEILKSRITLNVVISELKEEYGYEYNYYQLLGRIKCTAVDNTVIFTLSVTDSDPTRAINIANKLVEVLPDQISTIIDGASARVVDWAVDATSVSTGYMRQTMLGALIGAVIACAIIILRDCVFNDVIESVDWIAENFEMVPVLAEIPDINDQSTHRKSGKYYRYGYYKSEYNTDGKKSADAKKTDKSKGRDRS